MSMRHLAHGIAAAVLTLAAIALVGCTANPVAAKVVPVTSAPPSPSSTVTPTPSDSATVGVLGISAPTAKTVAIACSTLVPESVVTAFGPAFTTAAEYAPAAGSVEANIVAATGTACEWKDGSSTSTLQVAVAHPGASDLLDLKNSLVETSNSVPTYGEEAYFQTSGGVGEVDAFHGRYWIVATSPDFYEPGDATDVIAAVGTAIDGR